MGLPEVRIAFKEIAKKVIPEVGVGKILMILKDEDENVIGKKEYYSEEDIEKGYSEDNLQYIKDCFRGNIQDVRVNGFLEMQTYLPQKVTVFSFANTSTLDKALIELETEVFDFLLMPDAEEADNLKLVEFMKKLKKQNLETFLLLSTTKLNNSEDILEFEIDEFSEGEVSYTSAKLLPYIASICAGTPLEQSITYASLGGITNIATKTKEKTEELINKGKITLIKKGGKVRIASGVTSLTDLTKGASFKKIKPVRVYKYINNVISDVIVNYYVGKVKNSYTNKIVLITEIKAFLKELSAKELIEPTYIVDIDMAKQKEFIKESLKGEGVAIKDLTGDQIKQYNTGNKVFLLIKIKALDSMEDFEINVEV